MGDSSAIILGSVGAVVGGVAMTCSYGLGLVWYVNARRNDLDTVDKATVEELDEDGNVRTNTSGKTREKSTGNNYSNEGSHPSQNLPVVVTYNDRHEKAIMLAAEFLGMEHVRVTENSNRSIEYLRRKPRKKRTMHIIGLQTLVCSSRRKKGRNKKNKLLSGMLIWNSESCIPRKKKNSILGRTNVRYPYQEYYTSNTRDYQDSPWVDQKLLSTGNRSNINGNDALLLQSIIQSDSISTPAYLLSDARIFSSIMLNFLEFFVAFQEENNSVDLHHNQIMTRINNASGDNDFTSASTVHRMTENEKLLYRSLIQSMGSHPLAILHGVFDSR